MVEKKPVVFTIALILILMNAFIWLVFAIIWVTGALPHDTIPIELRRIMAALAAIASGALIVLYIFLRKRNHPVFYLTVAALAGLVLLTIMDEVGIADLVYLVIALSPLVLLLVSRRWYFHNGLQKK